MRNFFLISIFMVTGCVAAPEPIKIHSVFNEEEIKWVKNEGNNEIKGSALLRQRGGGVVTCAGNKVGAIPSSTYATERMRALYGNTNKGYNQTTLVEDPDPRYWEIILTTTCDAQGYFTFRDVPDGEYYIVTGIFWEISSQNQGGTLMERVKVENGEKIEIVLSQ